MKDVFKAFFTLIIFSSAFLVGLYLGEEKVKKKIPNFQEEIDKES
ncbi:MAG: hypothetical protein ACETWK_12375 [Candidatus Aminicenantaceae bacterium]